MEIVCYHIGANVALLTMTMGFNHVLHGDYLGVIFILQVSEDEITFLTGGDDPYDDNVVLKKLYHPNLKLLIVTEGSEGCRYYTKVSSSG